MAQILSHPFRLVGGRASTVAQTSDQAAAEQLAVLALTRKGERPLVPAFGLTDPTFADFDEAELDAAAQMFGPPVDIDDVAVEYPTAASEQVTVTFTRR